MKMNPIGIIISLIIGWFVVSLLQATGIAVLKGGWSHLLHHFKQIALFKESRGVLINLIVIAVAGTTGTLIRVSQRKKGR